jgi:hypothetical protein
MCKYLCAAYNTEISIVDKCHRRAQTYFSGMQKIPLPSLTTEMYF